MSHLFTLEGGIIDPFTTDFVLIVFLLRRILLILVAAQRFSTLHGDAEGVDRLGDFYFAFELTKDHDAVVDEGLGEHRLRLILKLLREVSGQHSIYVSL